MFQRIHLLQTQSSIFKIKQFIDSFYDYLKFKQNRVIMFEPNGRCLFTASQDYLQSLSWEPSKCYDSVYCQWKQVADMAICSNKLVQNYD